MTCAAVASAYVETLEARDRNVLAALLHHDVAYDLPQSRKRVRGRDAVLWLFCRVEDGLVTAVTDLWPEPFEPPPGRDHLMERTSTQP